MDVERSAPSSGARGSSLVGLLMIIVVLGALTAGAILGVSALTGSSKAVSGTGAGTTVGRSSGGSGPSGVTPTSSGGGAGNGVGDVGVGDVGIGGVGSESPGNACRTAADAASAASAVYYANRGGQFPVKWADMTTANPPTYELAPNVVIDSGNPAVLDGRGWKLTMSGGGTTQPTFTCS